MQGFYLGVEIGGTKQQIAVCDAHGAIVEMVAEKVPHVNGASDIRSWLEAKLAQVLSRHSGLSAIGVGFGGPLETATGRVLVSVQVPGWENFELKKWLEQKCKLPVIVVNDTVAGGYAELKAGSGRKSDKFFYTNIGTGIGGALFADGRTWDGVGYGAAYLGNAYTADWTAREPGAVAKIEALCSGTAIEHRLRTPGYVPKTSALHALSGGAIETLDCKALRLAAEQGDAFALQELDRVGRSFGLGVANVVTLLGVDTVAIGGGLANMGDWLLDPIRKHADTYVFVSGKNRYRIVACELLDNNVPIGAALYARDGFKTL